MGPSRDGKLQVWADKLFLQFEEFHPVPEVEGPADLPEDRVGPVPCLLALLRGSEGQYSRGGGFSDPFNRINYFRLHATLDDIEKQYENTILSLQTRVQDLESEKSLMGAEKKNQQLEVAESVSHLTK